MILQAPTLSQKLKILALLSLGVFFLWIVVIIVQKNFREKFEVSFVSEFFEDGVVFAVRKNQSAHRPILWNVKNSTAKEYFIPNINVIEGVFWRNKNYLLLVGYEGSWNGEAQIYLLDLNNLEYRRLTQSNTLKAGIFISNDEVSIYYYEYYRPANLRLLKEFRVMKLGLEGNESVLISNIVASFISIRGERQGKFYIYAKDVFNIQQYNENIKKDEYSSYLYSVSNNGLERVNLTRNFDIDYYSRPQIYDEFIFLIGAENKRKLSELFKISEHNVMREEFNKIYRFWSFDQKENKLFWCSSKFRSDLTCEPGYYYIKDVFSPESKTENWLSLPSPQIESVLVEGGL